MYVSYQKWFIFTTFLSTKQSTKFTTSHYFVISITDCKCSDSCVVILFKTEEESSKTKLKMNSKLTSIKLCYISI